MNQEIIALLMPAGASRKPSRQQPVEALVRRSDGRMAIERLRDRKDAKNRPWFRHGREIRDPDTREVIGYELERVAG